MFTVKQIIQQLSAHIVLPEHYELNEETLLEKCIHGISTLESATQQQLSFLANKKYQSQLEDTNALAVLVSEKVAEHCPVPAIVVSDPYLAFATLSTAFEYQANQTERAVIADSAKIAASAIIGDSVSIGNHVDIGEGVIVGKGTSIAANSVIGDGVKLGSDCVIGPNVTIYHHCVLGERVRVHANTVIGSEGFGFAPVLPNAENDSFSWKRIAQLGAVHIGDDVRIGANCCIDRGALDNTIIGNGVIIDNLVQIAHNVHIGEHTAIAACSGIAGSTRIGKRCILAGGVGVVGHVTITDDVQITGMTLVAGSISKAGSYSSGTTDMPSNDWRRAAVNFKHMSQVSVHKLADEISDLKTELNTLKSRLEN